MVVEALGHWEQHTELGGLLFEAPPDGQGRRGRPDRKGPDILSEEAVALEIVDAVNDAGGRRCEGK